MDTSSISRTSYLSQPKDFNGASKSGIDKTIFTLGNLPETILEVPGLPCL